MGVLRSTIKTLLKHVAFNTPLHRSMYNVYPYMYSPAELIFLSGCLSSIDSVPGSVVEAGCAYGATTVWLTKYMEDHAIERKYYALDTFCGFPRDHVDYERSERNKSVEVKRIMQSTFGDNKQAWFDKQMSLHDVDRVRSIRCDVGTFDFTALSPIAFCLLDVDLYLPVKAALPNIHQAMAPGGLLIIDDCWNDDKWDGALQAYNEFTTDNNLPPRIIGRKLGVIQR